MTPTVVSHYRLLNPLGEGGMGVVYRAEDLQLGREVAIKLLRTEAVTSTEWLARFEREAKLASSLQHPHICTIHELGEHGGQPFIAMELLEGRTVKQLIEEGPIPAARVLNFARQVAEALDAAHRRGIIHRDIKPANLFVTHGDRIKVLDFGLAKIASDTAAPASITASSPTLTSVHSPELTRTGSTVGTASYMAPEQAQGQAVDARTDLFSLGTVLYEMATARRAFGGDDIPLIVMKIINGIVVPPRAIQRFCPAWARGHHPEADGGRSAAAVSDGRRAAGRGEQCRAAARNRGTEVGPEGVGGPGAAAAPRSKRHDRGRSRSRPGRRALARFG